MKAALKKLMGWLRAKPEPKSRPKPWEDPNRPEWARELWIKAGPKALDAKKGAK